MEEDEAGRLKAFRRRFGRGWDAEEEVEGEGGKKGQEEEEEAEVLQVGAGEKGARKAAVSFFFFSSPFLSPTIAVKTDK